MAIPHSVHTAYVAIGSNLDSCAGDPVATVQAGIRALAEVAGEPDNDETLCSSLYRTVPVGFSLQPDFVNAVVRVRTRLDPEELLAALLAVEERFGRVRIHANGPRTLDLDLLFFDDLVLSTGDLVLPHPRASERRFVLAPLAEIAPKLVHPVLGKSIGALLAQLPDEGEQAGGVCLLKEHP